MDIFHSNKIHEGVKPWNLWREQNPSIKPDLSDDILSHDNLAKFNLRETNLMSAQCWETILNEADLNAANLKNAYFVEATLKNASLIEADLRRANLENADLSGANLAGANLSGAILASAKLINTNLFGANLTEATIKYADLTGANLCGASLIQTDLTRAKITGCKVYGASAWDLTLHQTRQTGLIITQNNQPVITVDNLEVAQFIYLLLNNRKLRDVINTIANKAVLIIGRFTGGGKEVLDTIAEKLRENKYIPIIFDFDRPIGKSFRETIQILAGLSKFVIADLSSPKSTPLESLAIFYNYKIPFLPVIKDRQRIFSMFNDFKLECGYLAPVKFKNIRHLKAIFNKQILFPAEKKHDEIIKLKSKL